MTAALTAPVVNLRVGAGSRFRHTFTSPLGDDGEPLDVSGWVGRGQIRPGPHSSTVLYTWPTGLITCSGATVTVRIPASTSALWAWKTAAYQIEVINPDESGGIYRVATGVVVVDPWPITVVTGWLYPSDDLYPSNSLYPRGPA